MSLGWTSDTVNVHDDVLCKTLEKKAHSEKFTDERDVQVRDEDDRQEERSRSKVQNIPMPDLEQTAAQSPGSMLQISSRRA